MKLMIWFTLLPVWVTCAMYLGAWFVQRGDGFFSWLGLLMTISWGIGVPVSLFVWECDRDYEKRYPRASEYNG